MATHTPTNTYTSNNKRYMNRHGSCPLLTNSNYSEWCSDIEMMLSSAEAIEIVRGNEEAPPEPTATTTAVGQARAEVKLEKYNKRKSLSVMNHWNSLSASTR